MKLQTTIDRHPEVAASLAALEGRRPGSILRGSQTLAPQDDENNPSRHCEERSDEAIHSHRLLGGMDCFAALAMTENTIRDSTEDTI
jgi:hypothetical protein